MLYFFFKHKYFYSTDGLSKLENTYSAMYISAYKRIQTHGIVPKPLIKDLRIRNAVNNYRNGRSSLEEYLKALSATTLQITEYDIGNYYDYYCSVCLLIYNSK